MANFKWVFNEGQEIAVLIACIITFICILVLTPSISDENRLRGMRFGVAEISVSFNHGGGGMWLQIRVSNLRN